MQNDFNNEWFQWKNHLKYIIFDSARVYFNEFVSLQDSKYIDVDVNHFTDWYV